MRRGLVGVIAVAAALTAGVPVAAPEPSRTDQCSIDALGTGPTSPYPTKPTAAISADGSTVAYGTLAGLVIVEDGVSEIAVTPRQYFTTFAPSLSADGSKIAYLDGYSTASQGGLRSGFDVVVLDRATGARTPLTDDLGMNLMPQISADGTSVAWLTHDGVFVHDLEAQTEISFPVEGADWWSPPAISPDGSEVAVTTFGTIVLHEVATATEREIASAPGRSFRRPRYLDDGRRLAVWTTDPLAGTNPSGAWRPAIVDLGTEGLTALGAPPMTPGPSNGIVSGDGSRVVSTSRRDPLGMNPDHSPELFSTEVATGAVTQLTDTTPGPVIPLAVSQDGRRNVFISGVGPQGHQIAIATTCDPAPRADAAVATAATRRYVGDDVYGVRPTASQKASAPIAAGGSRSFVVRLQNDRTAVDALTVEGRDAGRPGFTVQYRYLGAEVTNAVEAGTFTTGALDPGASVVLQVKVTADPGVPAGARHRVDVTARSAANPVAGDTVRARVRAFRGTP